MKTVKLLIITFFVIQFLSAQTDSIDYFGQTPPEDSAVIFAPYKISLPNRVEQKLIFSPDGKECYINIYSNDLSKIYWSKYINNEWTELEEVPFSVNLDIFMSGLSVDGNTLYFNKDDDIWKVNRIDSVWKEQEVLPSPVNSPSVDECYSESANGTICIRSKRSGRGEIWCIYPPFIEAENLGLDVNSGAYICDPHIAPDGTYIIYSAIRSGIYGNQDLFISFKKEGAGWTKSLNMEITGAGINIMNHSQNGPSLSPDGKNLFFRRHNALGEDHDIYWISTHVITKLKKQAFAPKLVNQIPDITITPDSALNYVIPENTFSCEYPVNSLLFSASKNNGDDLPSWLHFDPETRNLWGTPVQLETDSITITITNKDTVSSTCTFKLIVSPSTKITQVENQKLEVFLNPAQSTLQIEFSSLGQKQASYKIIDLSGKTLQSEKLGNNTIDVSRIEKGTYLLKIHVNGESLTSKFIIE